MTTSTVHDLHPATSPALTAARAGSPTRRRLLATLVAIGAIAVLGVATWLSPSEEGLGTHEQLSLPACGWITTMDLPCPTCGMTTSFSHAVRGNFTTAFLTQPMGFALALGTAMTVLIAGYIAITGSRVGQRLGRLWNGRTAWWFVGAIALAWVYKIVLYKDLLA